MTVDTNKSYRVLVPGPPAPWSVYTRQGVPSKSFLAMKEYQQQVQVAILEQVGRLNLTGPVSLSMFFACPHPARRPQVAAKWPAWAAKNPPVRWDLRNLEKAAEDACQGLLFPNDSMVVQSDSLKFYDPLQPSGYTIICVRRLVDSRAKGLRDDASL